MGTTSYNHRKGTTFRSAMIRTAEKRRCPKCNRKSAMTNREGGRYCRWCGYDPEFDALAAAQRRETHGD